MLHRAAIGRFSDDRDGRPRPGRLGYGVAAPVSSDRDFVRVADVSDYSAAKLAPENDPGVPYPTAGDDLPRTVSLSRHELVSGRFAGAIATRFASEEGAARRRTARSGFRIGESRR